MTAMHVLPATLLILFVPCLARAVEHPCAKGRLITGTVATFERGTTFRLTGSTQKYFPGDIVIDPLGGKLPALRGKVELFVDAETSDRYNRLPVQLFHDKVWIQGELLEQGQALTFIGPGNLACRRAMLDAETRFTRRSKNYWRNRGIKLGA